MLLISLREGEAPFLRQKPFVCHLECRVWTWQKHLLNYSCRFLHREKEKNPGLILDVWFFIRKVIRASLSFPARRKTCLFPLADSLRECTSGCLCICVYTSVINGVSRKMSDGAVSVRRKGSCTDEHAQRRQQRGADTRDSLTTKAEIGIRAHLVAETYCHAKEPSHTHTHK